jgi:organic radical activating enzyme
MKVIKIENSNSATLDVEFVLGNVCNYKCHYCFPGCHEGTHRWPDHQQIIENIKTLFAFYKNQGKQNIDLKIIGGEPTLWPHLETFINEIKKDIDVFVRISTNASRTLVYWKDKSDLFDEITISVHNEFVDLDHVIAVADYIHQRQRSNLYVFVLMDPLHWDRSVECMNYLATGNRGWGLSAQPVLFDSETRYNQEQFQYMKYTTRRYGSNPIPDKTQSIKMILENGAAEPYDYKKIVLNKANQFLGFDCNLGVDRIYINIDGEIKGACGETLFNKTLNIKDQDFTNKLHKVNQLSPVTCSQQICGCAAEIKLTKALAC